MKVIALESCGLHANSPLLPTKLLGLLVYTGRLLGGEPLPVDYSYLSHFYLHLTKPFFGGHHKSICDNRKRRHESYLGQEHAATREKRPVPRQEKLVLPRFELGL